MKTVYLDCANGITGEALLGALIDTGIDHNELIAAIKTFVSDDFELSVKKNKLNRPATEVQLVMPNKDHPVPSIETFTKTVAGHKKDEAICKGLENVFALLYSAGASHIDDSLKATGSDLIIAIAALAAMKQLLPGKIIAAPLPIKTTASGSFQKDCDQFSLEIARGITIQPSNKNNIINSPLGIALLAALTDEYGLLPEMTLEKVGYGSGRYKNLPGTIFRVITGYAHLNHGDQEKYERVVVVQTNIDDMNPEFYPYIMDKVLAAGALDIYLSPIIMKKGRAANQLTAICKHEKIEAVTTVIFKESTTLGIRLREEKRIVAGRRFETANTIYGSIKVKIGYLQQQKTPLHIAPEFDDCEQRARENGVPVKEVYAAAYHQVLRKYAALIGATEHAAE